MDKEAVGMEREAVTVWRDGRYKFWSAADAAYAQNDPDWLATIPLAQQAAAQAEGLDVESIAKAAWDEAWELAFSDGESAGHPLGRSRLNRDSEWGSSEVRAALAAQKKGA